MRQFKNLTVIALASFALSGCGGGSSSSPSITNPPPTSSGPTWTLGVFDDPASFKNRCENPRSGTDINGDPFPDIAGSVLYENHWLRSWSNDTYLWYSEITDRNPANYPDPITYFDLLKTNATTPSGAPKDQFHFTQNTAEYQQLVSSGSSAGYGARFAIIASAPPREIRVAYTEPSSPATTANLMRGTEILEIDGVDAVNGGTQADVNVLNAALFPSSEGETHTFVVRDVGSSTTRTVTMTSAIVTSAPVQNTKVVNTGTSTVGYMTFNTFGTRIAETELVSAFNTLASQNVTDLVLDLRYNGGGFLFISSQLAYMIAGSTRTAGKTYEKTVFNDKYPNTNPVTGEALQPTPFYDVTTSGAALPSLNLNRVFILSTGRTCSASEALINGLRGIDVEVILVGETTCGKPYGFYPTDNCGTTYFTIQFRGENEKGFGDYADGFIPSASNTPMSSNVKGCSVADDFLHLLGDENEAQFKTALDYIANGACPTTTQLSKQAVSSPLHKRDQYLESDLFSDERVRNLMLLQESRIDIFEETR